MPYDSDRMLLNDSGNLVSTEWLELPSRFPSVILDKFVVMPNHFHGIFSKHFIAEKVVEFDSLLVHTDPYYSAL
jgi:hypothetical protein